MQKVTEFTIDDIDGTDGASKFEFALDGVNYEIDLNTDNVAKLREALAPFVGVARVKAKTGVRKSASNTSDVDPAKVRVWAKENNISVADRGRLHLDVIAQYKAAN